MVQVLPRLISELRNFTKPSALASKLPGLSKGRKSNHHKFLECLTGNWEGGHLLGNARFQDIGQSEEPSQYLHWGLGGSSVDPKLDLSH